ncbi:MAG: alpha/beta fold hydrolase [Ardenticatenaceae bacterium]|nr:alpha/beta fold hydrolase [Ardenticatenaceae bacterium]MCB9004719.1 alpha/beta fold hydrolase [Ardenticatenaceae bacterium]
MNLQQLRISSICVLGLFFALTTTSHAQEATPRFEPSACPVDVPDSSPIDCGYLVVPENYDAPEGKTIRLPIIIIHSRSGNPAPDPVLYTEGGPGYSSLGSVWWLAQSGFVNNRDVVILEQRGNVYAQPNLACDLATAWGDEAGKPCLDSFMSQGIDLSQYTTAVIVEDIHALRQVLGYDAWNLYGGSYSTRLMQLTMQRHPEGVRSVILQSVSSLTETRYEHAPEHEMRALRQMLDDCAADPACAAAYPDLAAQLSTAVHNLNAAPASFELTNPETGELVTIAVDGYRFLDWMVTDAFYDPARPPYKTAYMPLLIDQVAQGNVELLRPWLDDEMNGRYRDIAFAWGLYFAVNCQDDAGGVTAEMMAAQTAVYPQLDGYVRWARELEICADWALPAAPPLLTDPLTSDIPTLILAGSYDPITPPGWGQAVAANLSHSYFYEFPSAGHNVDRDNPCAQQIKLAFLDDPTAVPDTSCMADVPGPSFLLPDDVAIAPGFYNSINDIDMGTPRGKPLLEFLTAVSLILFLLVMVYWLVAGVVWLIRRDKRPAVRMTPVLAGVTAVAGWALVLLISAVNHTLSRTDYLLLHFGLPLDYPPVTAVAILVPLFIALTIGLVILAAVDWKRRAGSAWQRTFFTLAAVAAILFAGLMMRWDLHTLLF